MKTIMKLTALLLVCQLMYGQEVVINVQPWVQTKTIDSIAVTILKDTVIAPVASFTGIDSGTVVYGPGIPEGAIVIANHSNDTLRFSAAATATTALASLNFNKVLSAAYVSGDWIGLPFLIYNNKTGGTVNLISVVIADSSDQLGNTDILLFDTFSGSLGLDTSAITVPATLFGNILGYVSLTTATDLGSVKMLEKDNINLLLPRGGKLYGRLIAKSTPTFTSTQALKLSFRFR